MNKIIDNFEQSFSEITEIIKSARQKVFKLVNTELINLYWQVGEYISKKVESSEWGKSIVDNLADYIEKTQPELKGFSNKNLWRMKQFYETYKDNTKLSELLRELSWTNNLIILSRAKTIEAKEFYIHLTIKEKYSKRELERQIDSSYFERHMLSDTKVSPLVREISSDISSTFKDNYVLEFLNLPKDFSEKELQKSIINNLKNFILEFGKDFAFIGEEYRVQVGNSDFFIDLLFFHRDLQCLVAFELKVTEFKPEYLGKINFYLEALDRDVKKVHENPSVGVILCTSKDNEVVEYALSRNISPALVAEYQTKLPDKKLLEQKLHEFLMLKEGDSN